MDTREKKLTRYANLKGKYVKTNDCSLNKYAHVADYFMPNMISALETDAPYIETAVLLTDNVLYIDTDTFTDKHWQGGVRPLGAYPINLDNETFRKTFVEISKEEFDNMVEKTTTKATNNNE